MSSAHRQARQAFSLPLLPGLTACLLLAATACGADAPTLSLLSSPGTLPTDGKSTAALTIKLAGYAGPVLLSTSRGSFQDSGAERTTVQAASGQASAILVSCDGAANPDCPGNASVVATAGDTTGFTIVTFTAP